MLKCSSNTKALTAFLLASAILLSAIFINCTPVKAQTTATVDVLPSTQGYTMPVPGIHTYPNGTAVSLIAVANDYFIFGYWEITTGTTATSDYADPATLIVNASIGNYVVWPVFYPMPEPDAEFPKPVVAATVLSVAGGTTLPAAGTYNFSNATVLTLTATPYNNWMFDHWVVSSTLGNQGAEPVTFVSASNPYNVTLGYGETYTCQPVFSPITSAVPTPTATPKITMPSKLIIPLMIALAITLVILVIVIVKRIARKQSLQHLIIPSLSSGSSSELSNKTSGGSEP